jgi:hypothetical protein
LSLGLGIAGEMTKSCREASSLVFAKLISTTPSPQRLHLCPFLSQYIQTRRLVDIFHVLMFYVASKPFFVPLEKLEDIMEGLLSSLVKAFQSFEFTFLLC